MILLALHYLLEMLSTTDWFAVAIQNWKVTLCLGFAALLVLYTRKAYEEDHPFQSGALFAAFLIVLFALIYAPFAPVEIGGGDDDRYYAPIVETTGETKSPDFRVQMQKNNESTCGPECRKVNATAWITNNGTAPAHGVRATLTLYGQLVRQHKIWQTTLRIGQLAVNQTITETRTATLKGDDLMAVAQNDCAIDYTIKIHHNQGTWTYKGTRELENGQCDVL